MPVEFTGGPPKILQKREASPLCSGASLKFKPGGMLSSNSFKSWFDRLSAVADSLPTDGLFWIDVLEIAS